MPSTIPALLATPGTAGAWMYGTTDTWNLHPATQGDRQYTTVVYVDDDPLATTEALAAIVEQRWRSGEVCPLFAGPLRTRSHWDAWPATRDGVDDTLIVVRGPRRADGERSFARPAIDRPTGGAPAETHDDTRG